MAKKKKQNKQAAPSPQQQPQQPGTAQKQAPPRQHGATVKQSKFLFGPVNYILMGAGVLLVIIGMVMMTGGGHEVGEPFNAEEKYAKSRILIPTLLILLGFAVEIVAIMRKPKAQ